MLEKILQNKYIRLALRIFSIITFVIIFVAITSGNIPKLFIVIFSHFLTQAIMLIWIGYRYKYDKYGAILNYIIFGIQFYLIFLWGKKYKNPIEFFQGDIKIDNQTKELNEAEYQKMLVEVRKQFDKRYDDKMTREQILLEVQDRMDFLGKDDLDQEAILEVYKKYFGINESAEIEKMYQNAVEYSPAKI
jgi:hypothetical protein